MGKASHHGFDVALILGLLAVVSLYDLKAPPISVTIWRQTQTAMLTENLLREGFSLQGLYLNLRGTEPLMIAYEFPIYNAIVGVPFKIFGPMPFFGKLLSLLASGIASVIFYRIVQATHGRIIALVAAIYFILLPVDVLMFTSFQPDALGLMFMVGSVYLILLWRDRCELRLLALFSISLLLCGLSKFPLLLPYVPFLTGAYFFPKGILRKPRLIELLVIGILFMLPFISWYLYRSRLTDPELLLHEAGGPMGDLSRFLSFGFYFRPAVMLAMLVFCGAGVIFFVFGLNKISRPEAVLISGIPFYYVTMETVADQYYYLFAASPIFAFFMAKGAVFLWGRARSRPGRFVNVTLHLGFAVFSLFGMQYVLRQDTVVIPATDSIRQISQPEDLIFVVNMHDRGSGVGGNNPTAVYFSKRRGWNVQDFNPDTPAPEEINRQIDEKMIRGAKWALITWYTPDLEPWYSQYLPRQFSRAPRFNSKTIAEELMQRHSVAVSGKNFAILSLLPGHRRQLR